MVVAWCALLLIALGGLPGATAAYQAGDFSDFGMRIQQVHLAQGKDPSSMVVSWVTDYPSPAFFRYGLKPNSLPMTATSTDVVRYTAFGATSGYIHHVPLTGLRPSTTYYYVIGDTTNPDGSAGLRYFITLPKVGQRVKNFQMAVAAGLGQTNDSLVTIDHLIADQDSSMLLLAGDTSYAECRPPLWDYWFNIMQPYAEQRPVMSIPGNHEIEFDPATGDAFQAYRNRYQMPQVRPEEITCPFPEPAPTQKRCTPSIYLSCYNYGNAYYSFNAATVHVVMLDSYTYSNVTSPQYAWIEQDLASVDRTVTPWVVVLMHSPFYNSNVAHQNEPHTLQMKEAIEPLLLKYKVNIVIAGHVHAYERTHPVYRDVLDQRNGITYIVVGDAANYEGHASDYIIPKPAWTAYRNGTQYGHGKLIFQNDRKLTWQWYRNVDGVKILRDEVTLCNTAKGLSVSCERQSSKTLSKMNPARGGASWRRRLAQRAEALLAAEEYE